MCWGGGGPNSYFCTIDSLLFSETIELFLLFINTIIPGNDFFA